MEPVPPRTPHTGAMGMKWCKVQEGDYILGGGEGVLAERSFCVLGATGHKMPLWDCRKGIGFKILRTQREGGSQEFSEKGSEWPSSRPAPPSGTAGGSLASHMGFLQLPRTPAGAMNSVWQGRMCVPCGSHGRDRKSFSLLQS